MSAPLDIRQLRVFEAVARTGSFSRAARDVFLTQSAVSHSLAALEAELQTRLFERTGRQARLTQTGQLLLKRVHVILAEMAAARAEIVEITAWGRGRLRLGASATSCQYLVPTILRELRECFPQAELVIEPGDSPHCLEMLQANTIDLALMVAPPTQEPLEQQALFQDELRFLVSSQHRWALQKRVPLAELHTERYIAYSQTSYTFRLIQEHLRREKVELSNVITLGNMEAIKELAKINLGVGILPPWVARRELDEGSLVALNRIGKPLQRDWIIAWLRGRKLTLIEETFLGLCRSMAENLQLREPSIRV